MMLPSIQQRFSEHQRTPGLDECSTRETKDAMSAEPCVRMASFQRGGSGAIDFFDPSAPNFPRARGHFLARLVL